MRIHGERVFAILWDRRRISSKKSTIAAVWEFNDCRLSLRERTFAAHVPSFRGAKGDNRTGVMIVAFRSAKGRLPLTIHPFAERKATIITPVRRIALKEPKCPSEYRYGREGFDRYYGLSI